MLLIESNPAYSVYKIDDATYIFYNTIRHIGCRLTNLEILILDMYYKYQDQDYIISKFPDRQKEILMKALDKIDVLGLLTVDKLEIIENYKEIRPHSFYLHLTYNCNLRCTYCYNRFIRRNNHTNLSISNWIKILDKILPTARSFVLTGGECFLHQDIYDIAKYIKDYDPKIRLSCITNGMHDFKQQAIQDVVKLLNSISFSCDSISREGERKGFNARLFRDNIEYLRKNYSNLAITVSSTYTKHNYADLLEIESFCKDNLCWFTRNIIIPETTEDIDLMPTLDELYKKIISKLSNDETKQLGSPRIRCGAGKEIWSIDPVGNVYPCQSLHYENMRMGNLLYDNISDIKYYASDEQCLPSVEDLTVCSKCDVKYICGGGCLASAYHINGDKPGRNHLTCALNHANSVAILKSLNNRLTDV